MWTLRNNQVLAESQISYDLEHLDVLNQIDSLTVDEHIWTKFKPIFEQKREKTKTFQTIRVSSLFLILS